MKYQESQSALLERMRQKLSRVVPDFEIKMKSEIVYEILKLKAEKDVVILGHNYMEPALYHFIPDHHGDSLGLSQIAAKATQSTIIFCGVKFMAETAKILNPTKTVLLPVKEAGCSLAQSITGEDVRKLRTQFPGVPVVTYVNTYTDVKAETDSCCTSSNAVRVVNHYGDQPILFLPDEFLAKNVAAETKRPLYVLGKDELPPFNELGNALLAWSGKCEVHERFTVDDIKAARHQFPDLTVMSHPECPPDVVQASDFSGSTTAMVKYVQSSKASRYMLLTECSMADNIIAENPDKEMVRLCSIRCQHMNQIQLKDVLHALRFNEYEITVEATMIEKARRSVEKMLEIG